MNPNATITIEDPRLLTWSATLVTEDNTAWAGSKGELYEVLAGLSIELIEAPDVLARRVHAAVAEEFRLVAINAHLGPALVGSWQIRFMVAGDHQGTYQLMLYGPGKGKTGVYHPLEALQAIVRTHTDGWHLQPDGSYVWIEPA